MGNSRVCQILAKFVRERPENLRIAIIAVAGLATFCVGSRLLGQYSAQTAAASAAAALETLEQWRPDVLVIDIAMPGQDGYDVIRRVEGTEGRPWGAHSRDSAHSVRAL